MGARRALVIAGCLAVVSMLAGCGSNRVEQSSTGQTTDSAMHEAHSSGQSHATDAPGDSAVARALISVAEPRPGATVTSPLQVKGQARGSWYFEASFPVRLIDSQGRVLDEAPAQAQGEWMTDQFVPFGTVLTFEPPTGTTGRLVLEKHNASGLPQLADSVVIPVRF